MRDVRQVTPGAQARGQSTALQTTMTIGGVVGGGGVVAPNTVVRIATIVVRLATIDRKSPFLDICNLHVGSSPGPF